MDEMLDIYDANMIKIGTKARQQVHLDGDWHRTFHCWIIYRDEHNRDWMLVQRRAPEKDLYPNLLDVTVGGHYRAGETIQDGLREIREELGIEVAFSQLVSLGIRYSAATDGQHVDLQFDDVFFLVHEAELTDYNFDRTEVAGLVLLDIDRALDMFAGQSSSMTARAVMLSADKRDLAPGDITITPDDFVPNLDRYTYRILILAKRFLNGEKHLAI